MAGPILTLHVRNDFEKLVKKLTSDVRGMKVKVGILSTAKPRESDGDDETPTNVEVAIANEFGTSSIPERSFLRSAFAANERKYIESLGNLMRANIINGFSVEQGLQQIGLEVTKDVKNGITQGEQIPPPNAPATLAAKLEKTREGSEGSPRTLVDTGQLVNSITHAVIKRGQE